MSTAYPPPGVAGRPGVAGKAGGAGVAPPPPVELVLSAKRATWRMHDGQHGAADADFQLIRTQILERDQHTCKGCGFTAKKWMEVHHRDDDHTNNTPSNLVTLCSFCHLCFHIGRAGMFQEAQLIWLPEIPQKTVNFIMPALYVAARDTASPYSETAQVLISMLEERAALMFETQLASSDPTVLGDLLLHLPDDVYDNRREILKGIRLLPKPRKMDGENNNIWGRIVDYWTSKDGPFGALPPASWNLVFDRIDKQIWSNLKP